MLWHDWLYELVTGICLDMDFLYLSFLRGYEELAGQIYCRGSVMPEGETAVPGLKSGFDLRIRWRLDGRARFMGRNAFTMTCEILDKHGGEIIRSESKRFDLTTGMEE